MLVYRNNRRLLRTADLLTPLLASATRLAAAPDHDGIRDLLVTFDAFESGLADSWQPENDGGTPLPESLQQAALTLAEAFRASFARHSADTATGLRRFLLTLTELQQLSLPAAIPVAEAEGYAWYALYPEGYALAAQRFLREVRPRAAVCVGIRQIGCSLSAVAAAVLTAAGCPVFRCTVRPRGHPFARTFHSAPALTATLRRHADSAHYLIIDEGPGLSGSSLCCVAETLCNLGVSAERILFLCACDPDPARFRSAMARRRWPQHRKIVAAFDPLRLIAGDAEAAAIEVSGGRWRENLLPSAAWPAVQPQHERRKFLWPQGGRFILAKFAGFGETGRATQSRGVRLAASGFIPPILGRRAGFLFSRFLPGRPLTTADVSRSLLERSAAYLARLRTDFSAPAATPAADLFAMLRHNLATGLGEEWAARLPDLANLYVETSATAIDGRMLPHEWLQTATGFVKTDALDHHADHFYPGSTDIAWDLAAMEREFRLSPAQAEFLRRRYADLSGDTRIERRLPFYRLAWPAFRLGYAQLAAESLGTGADAARFRRCAGFYRRSLEEHLNRRGSAFGRS